MAASPLVTGQRKRKSGVVTPKRATFRQRVAARFIWLFISAIGGTLRFRKLDGAGLFSGDKPPPQMIFAIWHNRLALSLLIYRRFLLRRWPDRHVAGLVSASRDGGLLARIMELFGAIPVRGSTSKRGAQGLLELTTAAEQGADLAVTPDGPRGPCYTVQEGIIAAAQVTGLPIVPVSYDLGWRIQLRSWDRFLIPIPFSRCVVRAAEPVQVPREADKAGREAARQLLETRLRGLVDEKSASPNG